LMNSCELIKKTKENSLKKSKKIEQQILELFFENWSIDGYYWDGNKHTVLWKEKQ
jgi:hypothetical protein